MGKGAAITVARWWTVGVSNNDGGKAFSVDAVKLWNSLPHNIKNKPSIKLFKTAVKKYFISSYRNLDNFETILSNSTLSNFNFL